MRASLAALSSYPRRRRFVRSDLVAALGTIALFVLVFVLRTSVYNPNDGIGLLFCLPIAVAAIRFGPIVGLAAGVVGFGLFVVWTRGTAEVDADAIAYSSRLVVFLVLGGAIGYFARARAELDTRSRLLFDLSPDFMGTLDARGHVISANEAWRSAAGHSHRDTIVPGWEDRLPVDDRPARFEETLDGPTSDRQTIEWYVRRDPRGGLLYVVGRDVTDRIEREAHVHELLAAVQDARASERASIASDLHDFVLQHLLVTLMHVEHADTNGLEQVDRFVRSAIASLRGVIDGILPLDFQHLDTATVLDRAATAVEHEWGITVERSIRIHGAVDQESKLLAFRLVGEALRNAAKHSGVESVTLEAVDSGGRLAVQVADGGCGLAQAVDVSDSLVPLYGTGFNLLIEHALASGGHTRITSSPGHGTTVAVEFPLERTDGNPA